MILKVLLVSLLINILFMGVLIIVISVFGKRQSKMISHINEMEINNNTNIRDLSNVCAQKTEMIEMRCKLESVDDRLSELTSDTLDTNKYISKKITDIDDFLAKKCYIRVRKSAEQPKE